METPNLAELTFISVLRPADSGPQWVVASGIVKIT